MLLLDQHLGKPGDEAALRAAAMPVPIELQRRLARVIGAIDHSVAEVKAALGVTSSADLRYLAGSHALYVPSLTAWDTSEAGIAKLDGVDIDRLADASALLSRAIEEADFGSLPDATFAPFEAQTPVGSIVVHDSAADTYKKGARPRNRCSSSISAATTSTRSPRGRAMTSARSRSRSTCAVRIRMATRSASTAPTAT